MWAEHVIDGDLGYEIDAREMPKDWPTGMVPLRKTRPYEQPVRPELEGEAYTLNQGLVDWALGLTKDVRLEDSEKAADCAGAVCGVSECFEAAVCDERGHAFGEYLLARRVDG